MKSRPQHAGSINLKGKRSKPLSCRCCECVDLRPKMLDERHRREMFEAARQ